MKDAGSRIATIAKVRYCPLNFLNFSSMARGGRRPNSGPKKGTKYAPTLAREAAEAHYRARVAERFDRVIDAQMETAAGIKEFVYRDDHGRFKVIDDPDELQARINLGQAIEILTRLPS